MALLPRCGSLPGGLIASACRAASSGFAAQFSSSASCSSEGGVSGPSERAASDRVASNSFASALHTVENEFSNSPLSAAEALADKLSPAQRALLAAALAKSNGEKVHDESYVDELFEAADVSGPKGLLSKSEFQQALMGHELLNKAATQPPDLRTLRLLFLGSAIPFVAFGFLDNSIMIVAGEEIDAVFGVRLGLSTLASAGLGNMVADVVGVGAANAIEQSVKRLPFVKEPALSRTQSLMRSTQTAKILGSMVGVMFGCLLGLSPLIIGNNFFVPGGRH